MKNNKNKDKKTTVKSILSSTPQELESILKQTYDPTSLVRTSIHYGNYVNEVRDISIFVSSDLERSTQRHDSMQSMVKTDEFTVTEIDDVAEYESLVTGSLTRPVLTQLTKYTCMGNLVLSALLTKGLPARGFSVLTSLSFASICQMNNSENAPEDKVMAKCIYDIIDNRDLCSSLPIVRTLNELFGIDVKVRNLVVRIPTYGCLMYGGGVMVEFKSLEEFVHWCYTINLHMLEASCKKHMLANLINDPNVEVIEKTPEQLLSVEKENAKLVRNKQHKEKSIDLSVIAQNRLGKCNKEWVLEAELEFDLTDFYSSNKSVKSLEKLLNQSEFDAYLDSVEQTYIQTHGVDISKDKIITLVANDLWSMFKLLAFENKITLYPNVNITLTDKFLVTDPNQLTEDKETLEDIYTHFMLPGITRWFQDYADRYESKMFKRGNIEDMLKSIDQFSAGWSMQYIDMRNHTAALDKFDKVLEELTTSEKHITSKLYTPEDTRQEVAIIDANYLEDALDDLELGQPQQAIVMRM